MTIIMQLEWRIILESVIVISMNQLWTEAIMSIIGSILLFHMLLIRCYGLGVKTISLVSVEIMQGNWCFICNSNFPAVFDWKSKATLRNTLVRQDSRSRCWPAQFTLSHWRTWQNDWINHDPTITRQIT